MSDRFSSCNATPEDAIVSFYGLLNEKQHDAAFDCLTPDFQNRVWKGDRADFAKGYLYTINITDVSYAPIKKENDQAELHVTYMDTVDALHHPLMDDLPKMPIKDLPKAVENIKAFNRLMVDELGGKPEEIEQIMLKHYFSRNNVETCLWLAKADYSRNEELFTRSAETIPVYRRAICVNSGDSGWKIEGLKYQ